MRPRPAPTPCAQVLLPTLMIIGDHSHPVFSPLTGGAAAEAECIPNWEGFSPLFPNFEVRHVSSDHIELPYTEATGQALLAFLEQQAGQRFPEDGIEEGRQAFVKVGQRRLVTQPAHSALIWK